jgi:purine-nucleoside phosphorylase
MKPLEKRIDESAEYLRQRITFLPRIGPILGSGLVDFADTLRDRDILRISDIPNYPTPAVEGHKGV